MQQLTELEKRKGGVHFQLAPGAEERIVALNRVIPIELFMLHYALVFLLVAIVAGVLGFGGIAGTAAWIAKLCFLVFLVFAILAFLKKAK